MDTDFETLKRLPPYVFNIIGELKAKARSRGEDIIDFSMGNPDQPTPQHIVDKLVETAQKPRVHRYSQSIGIPRLRRAICQWYQDRYNVKLNPETEAIATIGSKEGLAHLAMATMQRGDLAIVPAPAYPIHPYGFVIAGADIRHIHMDPSADFFGQLNQAIEESWPKPKMLVTNFPNNPTAMTVDVSFFKELVAIARKHEIWVVQDLAYADIVYDGVEAASILQVPGAKKLAVEFFSLSKSYNMPGWRVGFCCGNKDLIHALARIKSYLDYGTFTPIQVAAIAALEGDQSCVAEIRDMYQQRRDLLCDGLNALGWQVTRPKATMFVWAKIPEFYRIQKKMTSLDFSKHLLQKARIAVSPGIGFGAYGDDFVRIALIENNQRARQAIRGIKAMFRSDGFIS